MQKQFNLESQNLTDWLVRTGPSICIVHYIPHPHRQGVGPQSPIFLQRNNFIPTVRRVPQYLPGWLTTIRHHPYLSGPFVGQMLSIEGLYGLLLLTKSEDNAIGSVCLFFCLFVSLCTG